MFHLFIYVGRYLCDQIRFCLLAGETGRDFVEFIVKICAEREKGSSGLLDSLAVEGANVLQLLAATTTGVVEPVLWPHLLEYILQSEVSVHETIYFFLSAKMLKICYFSL